MGKPDPFLFELIQKEHGKIDVAKTIMIGDNYSTDIEFGFNCGLSTGLVLTGNTKLNEVSNFDRQPDFVLESLACLGKKE